MSASKPMPPLVRLAYRLYRDPTCSWTSAQRNVAMAIGVRLNKSGTAFMSYRDICERTRLSRTTVLNAAKALCESERPLFARRHRKCRSGQWVYEFEFVNAPLKFAARRDAARRAEPKRGPWRAPKDVPTDEVAASTSCTGGGSHRLAEGTTPCTSSGPTPVLEDSPLKNSQEDIPLESPLGTPMLAELSQQPGGEAAKAQAPSDEACREQRRRMWCVNCGKRSARGSDGESRRDDAVLVDAHVPEDARPRLSRKPADVRDRNGACNETRVTAGRKRDPGCSGWGFVSKKAISRWQPCEAAHVAFRSFVEDGGRRGHRVSRHPPEGRARGLDMTHGLIRGGVRVLFVRNSGFSSEHLRRSPPGPPEGPPTCVVRGGAQDRRGVVPRRDMSGPRGTRSCGRLWAPAHHLDHLVRPGRRNPFWPAKTTDPIGG